MKKLPIGIQTLESIINEGYLYVDKTEIALKLIQSGKYYFLSRPRRFGKSLFLDTLKEIFEGNKALFSGLYIEDKWDFEQKYPALRISFGSGINRNVAELQRSIRWILGRVEDDLDIKCSEGLLPKECLEELIIKGYEKYGKKAVILIDEYDKPILDNITDKEMARLMRDELKDFYSVFKDNDQYVQLLFITGVSKFSKMNLFSGLNNLNDITLNPDYGEICGYTQEDLETVFEPYLEGVDMSKVKEWYNGYNYFGKKVYNPFDILLFIFNGKQFKNYWWSTGNPKFLIDLLEKGNHFIPEVLNYEASEEMLNSFDVDTTHIEALLWQTGYLTIKEQVQYPFGMAYLLEVPNMEIQTSLSSLFINYLVEQEGGKIKIQRKLTQILQQGNLDELQGILEGLFASIPYHNFTNNHLADYEGYYASVVYAYLASLGYEIIPEDVSNKNRIDLTLKVGEKVYLFEFKVVEKATGAAMQQMKDRKYYEKYQTAPAVYLVGIEFGKSERNVVNYEWELLETKEC